MEKTLVNWLKEQRDKIIKEEDQKLFDEIAGCIQNGYLRAAYIMSWISLVECLKRKIREFANLDDARAKVSIQKIEDAEKKHLSVDKLICEQAKECEIIESSEFSTMEYLWQQRCLFAHPYQKKPDLEESKQIVHQSIKIALGKQLFYNKNLLEEICNNIVNKSYFLSNDPTDCKLEVNKYLARTPNRLKPFLFKVLFFQTGKLLEQPDPDSYTLRKLKIFIIRLLITSGKPLNHSDWNLEKRVDDFPFVSFVAYVHKTTWDKIPMAIKKKLIAYFLEERERLKAKNMRSFIANLIENKVLEGNFKAEYLKHLDENVSFNNAIQYYGDDEAFYERIREEMSSGQFDQQTEVINFLCTPEASKKINQMHFEKQIDIGRLVAEAADGNHFKSRDLRSMILFDNYEFTHLIKVGFAIANFISFGSWKNPQIIPDKFENSILCFNDSDEETQKYIYKKLNAAFEEKEPRYFEMKKFQKEKFDLFLLEKTKNIDWKNNHKSLFKGFLKTIKKYYHLEEAQ